MVLEILISTMNRKDISFLNNIFVNNDYKDFQILVINQTNSRTVLKSEFKNIRVINSFEYGLSKSRNLAIKNAIGDICLIADDDIQYMNGFERIILDAFLKEPNSSIIKFKIETFCGRNYKVYPRISKRLSKKKDLHGASSIEIAFKRQDILNHNILFNIFFGLGSIFPSGEEYLFLREALGENLIINFKNQSIVKHSFEHSTSNVTSIDFIKTQAAIYYIDYKNFSYLFLLKLILFLIRKKNVQIKETGVKFKMGLKGINDYKKIIKVSS
ncbi:MAG: glycosyltransferase involved in cell wall biosynthesis [Mariniflexile sp.]|jgi:glycosyltransferase involved in cell wall biosynthesis